jgi:hypothetical protein
LPEVILLEYYNNMPDPIIHIARDGVKIDMQQLAEIIRLFDAGTFKPTDHYWMSGMAEWGSLKDLIAKSRTPPPLPQDNAPKPAWMTPPKHKASIYGEEPATDKQKEFLLCFGVTLPVYLTKYDASRWLDSLLSNEEACAHKAGIETKKFLDRKDREFETGYWADGFKTLSGLNRSLRDESKKSGDESYQQALDEIEEMKSDGDLTESQEKEMRADADTDHKEWIDEVDAYNKTRIGYWEWIIKLSKLKGSEYDELFVNGISEGCSEGKDYEEGFGPTTESELLQSLIECAKSIKDLPSKKLISDTLDTLDSKSKTWDDDNPKLLLERLAALGK